LSGGGQIGTRLRNFVRPLVVHFRTAQVRRESTALPLTPSPLLVVAPHQDDETIGCGGLIARKRAGGASVTVAFLADGSRCFGEDYPDPAGLTAQRREEALRALETLGVPAADIHFLDLPDGGLDRLAEPAQREALSRLTDLMERYEIGEVCAPHFHDRHADHEAAYTIVRDAAALYDARRERGATPTALLQYLIWHFWESPLLAPVDWAEMREACCLALPKEAHAKKVRALREYRTQHALLPFGFWRSGARRWELYLRGEAKRSVEGKTPC